MALILWIISVQRALVVVDENINNKMSQIGVVLSSRWDAVTLLLELTKGYDKHEYCLKRLVICNSKIHKINVYL